MAISDIASNPTDLWLEGDWVSPNFPRNPGLISSGSGEKITLADSEDWRGERDSKSGKL
jgi:hypothetical protein